MSDPGVLSAPSLSLIFLAYNEAATMHEVLAEAVAFAERELAEWEIVLIDDGSTDQTGAIMEEWAEQHESVRFVAHSENRGMGAAMATGIDSAAMEYLVFLSSDGQAPVAELKKLFPLLRRADIALSTYAGSRRDLWRTLLSTGLRLYMRLLLGIRFQLEGLYLFPTAVAKELAPDIGAATFFFSFELIDRAIARGLTTATTEMEYRERRAGESKVANWSRIRRIGREVMAYRLRR